MSERERERERERGGGRMNVGTCYLKKHDWKLSSAAGQDGAQYKENGD